MTKKILKKSPRLSKAESYWDTVDQQTHYLIADLLNQTLPLPNLRDKKNLDLEQDADYCNLLFEYENNYSQTKNTIDSQTLAEEIAYEYLLLVVKSLLRSLSNFDYHLPDYFTGLTEL